jgi:hypothetical protein
MRKQLLLTIFFSFNFCLSHLSANDTTATIAGGQITYNKTDDVSIEEEFLKISLDDIQVRYVFKNHSNKEVKTLVAFPLPPSPVTLNDTSRVFPEWDESYRAYSYLAENIKNPEEQLATNSPLAQSLSQSSFVNFKRTIDGETYGYNYTIQAIDSSGNDITDLLEKNEIPLSSTYLSGFMDEPVLEKKPSLKKKLEDLKLLTDKGLPNWQTKTTYFWHQTFKPNSTTTVTHSYKPYVGHHWLQGSVPVKFLDDLKIDHRDLLPTGEVEQKSLKDFCPSEAQTKDILQMFSPEMAKQHKDVVSDSGITYRIKEIRYILSTGGNWKGPIKKFHLEIIPPTQKCLVLCCFEGKLEQDKNGHYVAEIIDFKPTSELRVLFVDPLNFEETSNKAK